MYNVVTNKIKTDFVTEYVLHVGKVSCTGVSYVSPLKIHNVIQYTSDCHV